MNSQAKVGQIEKETQKRLIEFLSTKLGYTYLGDWQDRQDNSNVEEEYLKKFLVKQKYPENLINKAITELNKAKDNNNKNLYDNNKEVYSLLRYGAKIKEVGKSSESVYFIDWDNFENNDFYVAEEVTIVGINNKRPDIVLYVNGIALVVIELKRSKVSISEGIRQNLDNQKEEFIKQFFSTIQIISAGNDTEGLKYGVIETPEKYYLTWKEDSKEKNILEKHIEKIYSKERLLEIVRNFVIFDMGVKKICRHNQYFGVKASQMSLRKREGGIIWHTQGSGKSLTMVWLTKWIKENIDDSRVLIITDREELDEQIEKVFLGVNELIYRTESGRDFINQLNKKDESIICSLVHKFGRDDKNNGDYMEELLSKIPKNFEAKGNIFVFVDECHRTQSGKFHKAMKSILPNAIFVGFTGTPLLKKDKKKSIEVFGKYIHTYKFDEAVKDKVILDLCYEARDINQRLTSKEKIDQWFEIKTKGLTEFAKIRLKKRWGTMQKVLSSRSRLDKVVQDILLDFELKPRLSSGKGNAMLVARGIAEACKYYELFQNHGFKKCAIVTSYEPSVSSTKGETTGEDDKTDNVLKYEVYNKMLNGKNIEDFEREVKDKFIKEPGQMKLLIVVDKLLTGFDAPPTTYLYIDKPMKDHGLFQAICRVNRLDGEDKQYGYIVDYKDLFKSVEGAIEDYTSDAFDEFDEEDIEGLLEDRLKKNSEDLDDSLETLRALCEGVKPPKETPEYIKYFCGEGKTKEELKDNEQKRIQLYKSTATMLRAFSNVANDFDEIGYSEKQFEKIRKEVKHYSDVREEIQLASGDYVDLKRFEPMMRHLIDSYINADESKKISEFEDTTILELIIKKGIDETIKRLPNSISKREDAVAETIENNISKRIIDKKATNPKYYEKMSALFLELVKKRKDSAIKYRDYLNRISELTKLIESVGASKDYPSELKSNAERVLYDNLDKDKNLALKLHDKICSTKKDGWRGNRIKEREVKYSIKKILKDSEQTDKIFDIVKNQEEY